MAARRIPDPKVGGSNPSSLIFASFAVCWCLLPNEFESCAVLPV